MLVLISDIHLVDGTAGDHNVPSRAFRYFFQDVAASVTPRTEEIKLVFLGDIFDLLRTEKWFDFPVAERPWGTKENETEAHANDIFAAIQNHPENRQTYALLSGSLKDRFGLPLEPLRIYIPGNHDRLCNKYPSLRAKVVDFLGLNHNPVQPFAHTFQDVNYGVFARHGHEFDKYNYEGGESYTPPDYLRVPIGDPITTELVAKLPYKITDRLATLPLTPQEKLSLRRNFEEVENVRPLSAVIDWLLYQVRQRRWLKEVIEDTVDEVIREFNDLDFVKGWYRDHDRWTNPFDEADRIQTLLYLLEKFKIFSTEKLSSLLVEAKNYLITDDLLEAAPKEYLHLDSRIRYVVYGHTHEALTVPLRTVPCNSGRAEHVYLNTGTWRARHRKAISDNSFISWKNMTYLFFYHAGEKETDFPVFETWTGGLKTI
ncbi:MAG: metallophosphoesterase [Deltaproteobacteria bacterium]|nr:metallophosphoesterase [Deltaproteobacteria bacterium]MBW1951798.1 metallophosphoesterase [Deltaproteobacteria bacterium]MBW1985636.1 metallophosphoesterase [Deltaproteobacteria bacterium]MBW2134424.1 metallophosphoesterase [Deltaproteobacteria bacterium]